MTRAGQTTNWRPTDACAKIDAKWKAAKVKRKLQGEQFKDEAVKWLDLSLRITFSTRDSVICAGIFPKASGL